LEAAPTARKPAQTKNESAQADFAPFVAAVSTARRLVAAQQHVTIQEYVIDTLEEQLDKDWAKLAEREGLIALSSHADPVLAELWDNEKDSAYDRS
jgi:hypothetical protein